MIVRNPANNTVYKVYNPLGEEELEKAKENRLRQEKRDKQYTFQNVSATQFARRAFRKQDRRR